MREPDYGSDLVSAAGKLTRGQLLDIVLDVEDRLKDLIRAVFARERSDWERLIPEEIRKTLVSTGPPDGSAWAGSEDPLRAATLKHAIDIVLARWKFFSPILGDKTTMAAHLEELRQWRNKLAHGLQPSKQEAVEIVLTASKVARRIPPPVLPVTAEPEGARSDHRYALAGCRILWADDVPEWTRRERRLFEELGAEVVPVLSNSEAIQEAMRAPFDVVVSDIDRGPGESGALLGARLEAAGIHIPIVFFIARLEPDLPLPTGAVGITNDPADLIRLVIDVLRPR